MPAPTEEVDGKLLEYHNHPSRFVQPHIRLFLAERRHYRRYKPTMRAYDDLNLRWLEAEDYFEMWFQQYQAEQIAKARGGNGSEGIS